MSVPWLFWRICRYGLVSDVWYGDEVVLLGGGRGVHGLLWDGLGALVLPTGPKEVDRLVETFGVCWRPGKYAAAGCLDLRSARLSVGPTQH